MNDFDLKKILAVKVVIEMGILEHSSNFQYCIKTTNKIPDYAKDFRNEYLFIIGINKKCKEFVKREDSVGEIFKSSQVMLNILVF